MRLIVEAMTEVDSILRFVPSAMTPIEFMDLYRGLAKHNNGLSVFEDAIRRYLGVEHSCTFTSFMRAIYACLESIKKTDKRVNVVLPRYSCMTFAHAII